MNNSTNMAVKGNEIEEAADIPEHEALTEPEDTSENIDEENVTQDLENNNGDTQ
jgi:hypothetical protein